MYCVTSIPKTLGIVCLAIIMLGACWACTTIPTAIAQIVGWVGLVFSGLCFIAMLLQLFRRGPAVILDEEGIHDLRSVQTVPWDDILSLSIGWVESSRFLCVEVRDPSIYLAHLPSHKRLLAKGSAVMGFTPITMSFQGLTPGIDQVWSYIQTHHPEKIAG